MQFTTRLLTINRLGVGFGLLLLNSWSMVAAARPFPQRESQQQWGGIPISCQMQQIRQMPNSSDRRNAFIHLFEIYTGAGQDALTLQLAEAIASQDDLDIKAEILLWVARDARRNGENARAVPLLSQAFQLALTLKHGDNNPYLLRRIGEEFIAVGQPKSAATALLASMQAFQASPGKTDLKRVEFFFSMAKLYIALGQPASAVALLDRSVQMVRSQPDSYRTPFQTKATLLAIASSQYGIAGESAKADAFFAESLKLATSVQEAEILGQQLLILFRTISVSLPADELAQLPAAQQARLLADQQKKSNQVLEQLLTAIKPLKNRVDILQNIALMWAVDHQIERAVQLANTLTDPEDKFFILIMIIPDAENRQQANQAMPLLAQALDAARSMKGWTRDYALSMLASDYAEWGERSQALQILETIQDADQKQATQANVAAKLALAGQPDVALTLAQSLPHERIDPILSQIALAYTKAGQLDRALQIEASISRIATKNQTLRGMAAALAELNNSQQAVALLQNVTDAEMRYRELYDLADRLLTSGHLDQSLALVQPSPETHLLESIYETRKDLLRQIATAYAEAGQYPKALQIAQIIPDKSLMQLITCADHQFKLGHQN